MLQEPARKLAARSTTTTSSKTSSRGPSSAAGDHLGPEEPVFPAVDDQRSVVSPDFE